MMAGDDLSDYSNTNLIPIKNVPGPGLLFQVRVLGFLPRKDAWSDNVSGKEAATELVLLRGQARNQTKQQ